MSDTFEPNLRLGVFVNLLWVMNYGMGYMNLGLHDFGRKKLDEHSADL